MALNSKLSLKLAELARHPLRDAQSDTKIALALSAFHHSIVANLPTQPHPIEAFKFLIDLPKLRKELQNIDVLAGLTSKTQVEHMYVTLLRRLDKQQDGHMPPETALIMSRLYNQYPYLKEPRNSIHEIHSGIEAGAFCEKRALFKLRENAWNEHMSRGRGAAIKWYLISGLAAFAALNVWVLYKRVEFYMEHSFDILNPDIDYLIDRY